MVLDLPQLCARLDIPVPVLFPAFEPKQIRGVNTLEMAGQTDLCFAEGLEQAAAVQGSRAAAVLVHDNFPAVTGPALIRVAEPRASFFLLADPSCRSPRCRAFIPARSSTVARCWGPGRRLAPAR